MSGRQRPRGASAWTELLDASPQLSPREREAMTIHYVEWPEGASNLEYMTQRAMAEKLGISLVGFRLLLHRAEYKLGLTVFPPRMRKIPLSARIALIAAVDEETRCDLCQRPLGRTPVPPNALVWAGLLGPPRFAERLSVDHIVPVSRGGTEELSNLRLVHALCNARDGARRPLEEYEPVPFGYVRRREELPNGRGPRTWIEVLPNEAAVVKWVYAEYATGNHSIRSLAAALASQADSLDKAAVAPLLRGSLEARSKRVVGLLQERRYRGGSRESLAEKHNSPYARLVDPETSARCERLLEVRWLRIQRGRETREARRQEAERALRPPSKALTAPDPRRTRSLHRGI